jgi:hypothetical protein
MPINCNKNVEKTNGLIEQGAIAVEPNVTVVKGVKFTLRPTQNRRVAMPKRAS